MKLLYLLECLILVPFPTQAIFKYCCPQLPAVKPTSITRANRNNGPSDGERSNSWGCSSPLNKALQSWYALTPLHLHLPPLDLPPCSQSLSFQDRQSQISVGYLIKKEPSSGCPGKSRLPLLLQVTPSRLWKAPGWFIFHNNVFEKLHVTAAFLFWICTAQQKFSERKPTPCWEVNTEDGGVNMQCVKTLAEQRCVFRWNILRTNVLWEEKHPLLLCLPLCFYLFPLSLIILRY